MLYFIKKLFKAWLFTKLQQRIFKKVRRNHGYDDHYDHYRHHSYRSRRGSFLDFFTAAPHSSARSHNKLFRFLKN